MKPLIADLHMHSVMSGHAFGTIRELAFAASEKKLLAIGVTEHGPGIPGTVQPIYFRNLIDAPRELYGVEMLYGSEVNVLNDGTVDLDARHLKCLDYAIAGIHGLCYEDAGKVKNTDNILSCLAIGKVKNTDNILSCLAIGKVKFISHPDCDTYPVDYPALVAGAKSLGKALELNNSSLRKPKLRPGCVKNYHEMLPLCAEMGVPIIINTDAHDPSYVGNFAMAQALVEEIGVPDELILNNDLDKLKAFLLAP